jgi:hypothetical protein
LSVAYSGDAPRRGRQSCVRGARVPTPLPYDVLRAFDYKKPGAPDSPSTIQDTKRYLQDFDRIQKTATSDQELFDQMTELYPHWVAN